MEIERNIRSQSEADIEGFKAAKERVEMAVERMIRSVVVGSRETKKSVHKDRQYLGVAELIRQSKIDMTEMHDVIEEFSQVV